MTKYPKAPSSFLTSIISSRYLSVWIAIGLLIVIALLIALETLTRTSFTTVLPLTSFLAREALIRDVTAAMQDYLNDEGLAFPIEGHIAVGKK